MRAILPACRLFAGCLVALSLTAAFAQPPKANNGTPKGKQVALLVAVNDCNHDRFPALKFAENDVEELAVFLTKSGYAQVRVLSGTRGKKNAKDAPTAANVRSALAKTLASRGRHDTVLIALAGHGVQMEVSDPEQQQPAKSFGYFCPADADLSEVRFADGHAPRLILFDQLLTDLGRCGAANRLLLVDAGRLEEGDATSRSLDTQRVTLPRGTAALFSCARGQTARETDKLGKGHGLFFYSVLEGLKGRAKNEDGEITWDLLSAHVKRQVGQLAKAHVGPRVAQTPHGMNNLVGDPVLHRVGGPITKVEPTGPPRKVALLVGVREYADPKFPSLKYTENDVEELAPLLSGKTAGFDEVVLLTTTRGAKDKTKAPTAKNVREQLKKLLAKLRPEDLILVGFSGHGMQLRVSDGQKKREEPFLMPSDGKAPTSKNRSELSKTLLPVGELIEEMQNSKAGTRLLLLDAGRDEVDQTRSMQNVEGLAQLGGVKLKMGTALMFSCSSGQRAFETDKLGKGHGVFFYFVIQALKGEAANDKGEVTWGRLTEYVSEKTTQQTPKLIGGGAKQTPHEIGHLAGRSPLLARVK